MGSRCQPIGIALAAAALACAAPAAASASPISALHRAERLASAPAGPSRELTPALLRLARAYHALPASGRRRAAALLARPTDPNDPNRHAYTAPEDPRSPACTPHFCVHWVVGGKDAPDPADDNGVADGDGIPDYVELVQGVAEHVYSIENGTLAWQPPRSDRRKGGKWGRTDIYLTQLSGSLFGYAAPDRSQATSRHRIPRRLYGYLVLDNDYASSEFPRTTPLADLEVTMAHEYNHILQFGYDAYQDPWFAESTAVWMEDQVYGSINDYLRYMRRWARLTETPLTATSIKEYGSAVWNHWLAHRYGPGVIRAAWARAAHTKPGGFSVSAYDSAIRAAGGPGFSRDFARFAADVAEWRTDTAFSEGDSYPNVVRRGRLSGGRIAYRYLNHTTFAMLRVSPRSAKRLVVAAAAPRHVAAALALVGRTGGEKSGSVVIASTFRKRGGLMRVHLRRPQRFHRITAVLVNADARALGFNPRRLDWRYLDDGVRFAAAAKFVR